MKYNEEAIVALVFGAFITAGIFLIGFLPCKTSARPQAEAEPARIFWTVSQYQKCYNFSVQYGVASFDVDFDGGVKHVMIGGNWTAEQITPK